MPDALPGILIAGFFFGSIIAYVFYGEAKRQPLRKERKLYRRTKAGAADAAEGELVKIVGSVLPAPEALVAPVSGRPCHAWQLEVRYLAATGRGRGGIMRRAMLRRSAPFEMQGEGGRASVEGESFVLLGKGTIVDLQSRNAPSRLREALLMDPEFDPATNKTLRIVETVIESGQQLGAAGLCHWQHDPASHDGYRSSGKSVCICAGSLGVILGDA